MNDEPIDTGLGDLIIESVSPTAPALVTAAVTVKPKADLPKGFSLPQVMSLARDMAVMLFDEPTILDNNGITEEQLNYLKENEFFKQQLELASAEWHSIKSVNQRIALGAAMIVEDALPTIGARLKTSQEPLAGVVQGLTAVSKIAGLGEKPQGQQTPGEKFTITINLGAANQKVIESSPILDNDGLEVRPLPEGDSPAASIQLLTSPARD